MERLENKQILGVIDATIDIDSLAPLTLNRPVASLPFAGRYRLIDFMLSNMLYAGIDSVGVFSHHLHNSLKGHIASGKVWDLDRKNGGLFFYVQNEQEKDRAQIILKHNQEFFLRAPFKYVVIAPSNIIGRVPILEMLKKHTDKEARITQAVSSGESLPIYLLEREHLVDLISKIDPEEPNTLMGFIEQAIKDESKNFYHVDEYLVTIDSLLCYYNGTMDLLKLYNWEMLFQKQFPVLTKTKDEPPAKYSPNSLVTSSIIANGCIINGTVVNSVVARGVKIGKDATIRNCIIMPGVEISEDCFLTGGIVDKDVTIESGAKLTGSKDDPFVVPKGITVYKEWWK